MCSIMIPQVVRRTLLVSGMGAAFLLSGRLAVAQSPTPTIPPEVATCAPAPVSGCRSPGNASLRIAKDTDPSRNTLRWKWSRGAATAMADFGNPTQDAPAGAGYALCVYDEIDSNPTLVMSASVSAGGTCAGGRACWRSAGTTGFKYRDSDLGQDGIQAITLKSGSKGRAKVSLKGKGANLPLPALPFAQNQNITVQLVNAAGLCWSSSFSAPAKNNTAFGFSDRQRGDEPRFPGLVLVVPKDMNTAQLAWVPAVDDNTAAADIRYDIYMSLGSSFAPSTNTFFKSVTGDTQTELTGLTENTTYYVLVVATDQDHNSSFERDIHSLTTPAFPLALNPSTSLETADQLNLGPPTQEDAGSLTFTTQAGSTPPTVGSVLVGYSDQGGFLRRVESVSQVGGDIIVGTSSAALQDVVDDFSLKSEVTLLDVAQAGQGAAASVGAASSAVAYRSSRVLPSGSRVSRMEWRDRLVIAEQVDNAAVENGLQVIPGAPGQFELTTSGVVNETAGRAAQVITNGGFSAALDLSFQPEFHADAEWRKQYLPPSVELLSAYVIARGTLKLDVDASYDFSGAATFQAGPVELFHRTYLATYALAGVPVVQETTLTVSAQASGQATAEVHASADASASVSVQAGVVYDPGTGTWQPMSSLERNSGIVVQLNVAGGVQAEVRLIPEITLRFYRVVAGTLSVEPYVGGSMDAQGTLVPLCTPMEIQSLNFDLGAQCHAEVDLSVLSRTFTLMSRRQVCTYTWPLYSLPSVSLAASGGSGGQPFNLTATAIPGVHDQISPASAQWDASPAGRGVLAVNSSNRLSATFTCSQPGTVTITVGANGALGSITRQCAQTDVVCPLALPSNTPTRTPTKTPTRTITPTWTPTNTPTRTPTTGSAACTPSSMQSCSTGLPGICSAGTESCNAQGTGYGSCIQDQSATTETTAAGTCSDGLDNDCDGSTDAADPGCQSCVPDSIQPCSTGLPGICSAGTERCNAQGTGYGSCVQNQGAQPEGPYGSASCTDSLDNDCDGFTDASDSNCQQICSYSLSSPGSSFTPTGGTGSVDVTAPGGCPWSVSGVPSWITLTSPSSGAGNSTVTYLVQSNGGGVRSATLSIGGQSHNVIQSAELLGNGSFESGEVYWTAAADFCQGVAGPSDSFGIVQLSYPHTGSWYAYLGDNATFNGCGKVQQLIMIPPGASSATLSFWLNVRTYDGVATPYDHLYVNLRSYPADVVVLNPINFSNVSAAATGNQDGGAGYAFHTMSLNVLPYAGQMLVLQFFADTDGSYGTIFRIDDASFAVQ